MEQPNSTLVKIQEAEKLLANFTDIKDAPKWLALTAGFATTANKQYQISKRVSIGMTIENGKRERDFAYQAAVSASELRLKTFAKLGELIRIGQTEGTLYQPNGKRPTDSGVSRLSDIGLTDKDSSRAQMLFDHQDLIQVVVEKAKEVEDVPTRRDVENVIKEQEGRGGKTSPEWFRVYNVWNFQLDKSLGIEHPGNIPGQIALNTIHYYTNEGDLVVDPMAGGGSTIDAAIQLKRRCLAYDIDVKRDDIFYNDITKGFPPPTKNCDLIFLDPPYYKIMRAEYVDESVSSLELQDFLTFLKTLAKDCFFTVKNGGFVSFLCQNYYHKFASLEGGYTNFGIEGYKAFLSAGFTLVNEINCPQTTEVYSASDVERAKKQRGMLNLVRDLLIFRKENG